jgi:hypothetical protein
MAGADFVLKVPAKPEELRAAVVECLRLVLG